MNNIDLISKVLQYIDVHISEDISFKTLADIYGYSSFHFHRIFTAITNLTITNYIKDRRLKLAYNYLLDNDLTCVSNTVLTAYKLLIEALGICLV